MAYDRVDDRLKAYTLGGLPPEGPQSGWSPGTPGPEASRREREEKVPGAP